MPESPGGPTVRPSAPRPLVVTADPELLDDLLRLATAADVEVTVAHTIDHAARAWTRSPLVVVGSDLAARLAGSEPGRHPNCVLAHRGAPPPDTGGDLWRTAVQIGAHHVIGLPADENQLIDLLVDGAEGPGQLATTVGVVGGCGGAGASLLSTALALAGARARLRTMLIDADPLGSGLDLLLGHEHASGARWDDLAARHGRINRGALLGALPVVNDIALLTWGHDATPRIPVAAMRSVLTSAARATDLMVVDLPRDPDAAAVEALRRAASVLVVLPAGVRAVVATGRVCAALRRHASDLRVVVRDGRSAGLDATTVATSLGVPLAGRLPREAGLARILERGDAPAIRSRSPIGRFCDRLLDRLLHAARHAPEAAGAP